MNRRLLLSILGTLFAASKVRPAMAHAETMPKNGKTYLVLYDYEHGEWKPKNAWEVTG